jgi:hypothetical protein
MTTLISKVIIYLNDNGVDYKTERPKWSVTEFCITDNGEGAFIENWDASKIGLAKPTNKQLNTLDAKATTHQNNAKVDATRRTSYGSWNEQLDEIYHNIDDWKARIKKIKDDNPKESS